MCSSQPVFVNVTVLRLSCYLHVLRTIVILYHVEMELAKEIIGGLASIQNSNILPEETFLQLLDIIMLYIFKNINNGKSKQILFYLSQNIRIFEIKMFIINYILYSRYCYCMSIQIRCNKGCCSQYILPLYRGCST